MSDEAVWRGNCVQVLSKSVKCAVIITPCGYALKVCTSELRDSSRRRKIRPDSQRGITL